MAREVRQRGQGQQLGAEAGRTLPWSLQRKCSPRTPSSQTSLEVWRDAGLSPGSCVPP